MTGMEVYTGKESEEGWLGICGRHPLKGYGCLLL